MSPMVLGPTRVGSAFRRRRTPLVLVGGLLLAVSTSTAFSVANQTVEQTEAHADSFTLPWSALETPATDLAAVHHAVRTESAEARRAAVEAIADDPALAGRMRGVAQFHLGTAALDRRRWTEAAERLTAPELTEGALAADALHMLGARLPDSRDEAIPALERLLDEFPDYERRLPARLELGRRLQRAGKHEAALAHLEAVIEDAPFVLRGDALHASARALASLGRHEERARRLETLYYDMPTHGRSLDAGRTLSQLYRRSDVASPSAEEKYPRAMRRAAGFARAGDHRKAHQNYLEVARRFGSASDEELVRLRIGVAEFRRGRLSAALRTLGRIRREDLRPEALYYRGEALRRLERLTTQSRVLEELLALEQEHPFGARALNSLARARLAQNDREAALPYLERLADQFPEAANGLFARWHVLWDRYRRGELDTAAADFEQAARENPGAFMAGQFLYFAARSLERTGDPGAAAPLYREVFVGYQNSFYGRLAAERLRDIEGPDALASPLGDPDLLLDGLRFERTDTAARIEELHAAGFEERALDAAQAAAQAGQQDDPAFHAMAGWLLANDDQHVPAIQALGRAAPFFTSAGGEALPSDWWRLLFPLRYEDRLNAQSERWNLDPFLVAALIRQESAFTPRTRSPVGARGLMQIMPATGRALARLEGMTHRVSRLYDPVVNIRFGTRYLRQLLDEFGDRPELALAAYNAGPHRVRNWTADVSDRGSELFIEEIPFTETRNYVKLIMRNEMLYRRIYPDLPATPTAE